MIPSINKKPRQEILRQDSDKTATEIGCGLKQRVTIVRHGAKVLLSPLPLRDEIAQRDPAHSNREPGEAGDHSHSDLRAHSIPPPNPEYHYFIRSQIILPELSRDGIGRAGHQVSTRGNRT